jgi:hypothetical protein
MNYKSVKQFDGTYYIYESKHGLSWQVLMTNVRGCNVSRIINRLITIDFLTDRK